MTKEEYTRLFRPYYRKATLETLNEFFLEHRIKKRHMKGIVILGGGAVIPEINNYIDSFGI